jgi:uncharacterized protein (TIGR00299 family) protein
VSRTVYLDGSGGAAGDMILGALVDLGLPLDRLEVELRTLGLPGWSLRSQRVDRSGLRATKVDVVLHEDPHAHHHHEHAHGHTHLQGAKHRGLRDILPMIERSTLEPPVKARSVALFRRLAEAEGAVHGIAPDEVHFHEVGAVDSIVDIVGCVLGLHWLGADRFVASPLNVGTGRVQMAHGSFPVPAPATARLLEGVPVIADGEGELLTPTGALVLTAFADAYGPLPSITLRATGYGAGTRDTPGRPNVMRIVVGDAAAAPAREPEQVLVLECEVDDMSPQLVGPVMDRLFAAGALDVYVTSVQMKKDRPGLLLSALVPPERRGEAEEALLAETTTLGVRCTPASRTTLERWTVTVATPYGEVPVKVGARRGRVYNAQPEFADCRRLADSHGVPVKEVQAAALAAYRAAGPGPGSR